MSQPAPALPVALLGAFFGMANTKNSPRNQTYAQNPCCGAARNGMQSMDCYETNSDGKCLIYMVSSNCGFFGQCNEALDSQGLGPSDGDLSTKLSTEILKICKALLNQALRPASASAFEGHVTGCHAS